jgi:hypothetical protein
MAGGPNETIAVRDLAPGCGASSQSDGFSLPMIVYHLY